MIRKQELKLLILSDLSDFDEKVVLERLNVLKRRHYDMVAIIGNINKVLLLEISLLFESALIVSLDKNHRNQTMFNELGVIDFNLKKQRISNTMVFGYGSRYNNKKAIPIDKIGEYGGDILISYHAPNRLNENPNYKEDDNFDTEEINRYAAFRKPKLVFHGGRKQYKKTELSNGTKVISVYGILSYIIKYDKEVD